MRTARSNRTSRQCAEIFRPWHSPEYSILRHIKSELVRNRMRQSSDFLFDLFDDRQDLRARPPADTILYIGIRARCDSFSWATDQRPDEDARNGGRFNTLAANIDPAQTSENKNASALGTPFAWTPCNSENRNAEDETHRMHRFAQHIICD